jgi:hypothetical protein
MICESDIYLGDLEKKYLSYVKLKFCIGWWVGSGAHGATSTGT